MFVVSTATNRSMRFVALMGILLITQQRDKRFPNRLIRNLKAVSPCAKPENYCI